MACSERSYVKKLLISVIAALVIASPAFGQGISVWTTWGDQTLVWLQEQATSFTAAFGVPVEIVVMGIGDVREQALLSAPQGEAADLFAGIPHDQIGEMAAGGILADMTGFATSAYLADLSDQARLAYSIGGKLFGLPMYVEGPALIINTNLIAAVPASYQELIAQARDLTTADTFGFMYDIANFYFAYNWLRTAGGYVFGRDAAGDLDPAAIGLANEGAILGAEWIRDLRFVHNLIPPGTNYDVANGLFIDGGLAMIYNGPWAISQYREAGIPVIVAPMPPVNGNPWSGFMGVQGVLMNEFSPNKIDAANFAKWLARTDAQVSLARATGRIPASNSALAQVADDPVIAGFGAALANAEPMPNIPEMGRVWGPMGDALNVILETPDSDIPTILERAVEQIRGN